MRQLGACVVNNSILSNNLNHMVDPLYIMHYGFPHMAFWIDESQCFFFFLSLFFFNLAKLLGENEIER